MNKLTVGLLTLGSLVLGGCSDSEGPAEPTIPNKTIAVYIPASGKVPVPNDLLFNAREEEDKDLTLDVPAINGDDDDFSDPAVAMSGLDGWSTHSAFSFELMHRTPGVQI